MKKYKILFTEKAKKQLFKLNKSTQKLITAWMAKNLQDTDNPRQHGKALSGNKSGYWRYRVADYRIIVEIQDEELVILAIAIAHRRQVYTNK